MLAPLRGSGDDVPFDVRLGETIAWCSSRLDPSNPAGCFRSDRLKPSTPEAWDGEVLRKNREATVRDVVDGRARGLDAGSASPVSSDDDLEGGRLLVYYPDDHVSDGAAEAETGGFFDVCNAPPWDTWVGLFRDATERRYAYETGFDEYLISWVPAEFVELAENGIEVDPVASIVWLTDSGVRVADALRAARILDTTP